MRPIMALAALSMLTACRVTTEPLYGDGDAGGQHCPAGSTESSRGCIPNYQTPAVTVISIGPSREYTDSADVMCYSLTPAPASIKAGGSYRFQNNTSASITIVDSNGIPWVTVGPYAASGALSESAAGVYGFGIQACKGMAGTPWYGVLDVTIN